MRHHKLTLTERKLRRMFGGSPYRIWGSGTDAALELMLRTNGENAGATSHLPGTEQIQAMASSFADPADLVAFHECKRTGRTDEQCFKVGDNGVGQFGKVTAQTHTPMVALHADDMIAKWGSVAAAAHRKVRVTVGKRGVTARVEDRLGIRGRIDLNPAATKALGLNPPFLMPCTWRWV